MREIIDDKIDESSKRKASKNIRKIDQIVKAICAFRIVDCEPRHLTRCEITAFVLQDDLVLGIDGICPDGKLPIFNELLRAVPYELKIGKQNIIVSACNSCKYNHSGLTCNALKVNNELIFDKDSFDEGKYKYLLPIIQEMNANMLDRRDIEAIFCLLNERLFLEWVVYVKRNIRNDCINSTSISDIYSIMINEHNNRLKIILGGLSKSIDSHNRNKLWEKYRHTVDKKMGCLKTKLNELIGYEKAI